MVSMMLFLVYLASQAAPVKSNTQILLSQEEVSRNGTSSSPDASEFITCASITQDKVFQIIFGDKSILLPFLNDVLENNIPHKLTDVEVPGDEQSMFAAGQQYNLYHDIRALDANGNAYIIEMERVCQLHDIVRFQYTASRVFSKLIDTRFRKLREKAVEEAMAETKKAKEAAAMAAEGKAKAQKANSAEVLAAKTKAIKAVKKARPKPVSHEDLFRPNDIPIVLVIVIVEGETEKLTTPNTTLDHWCLFLWTAKDRRIKKNRLRKWMTMPGIGEAIKSLGSLSSQVAEEVEAFEIRDENLREEGRAKGLEEGRVDVARAMLHNKINDTTIIELTKISKDQLEELKSSL